MDMPPISVSKTHCLLDGESSGNPRESLVTLDLCLDETCRPSENPNMGKKSTYDPKVACRPKDKKLPGKRRNRAHMRLLSDEERREKKRYNLSTKPTLFTDRWTFTKKLTESNLGHESCLPLSNKFVDNHILICFPENDKRMVQEGSELTVNVYDHDTNSTHQILLGKWSKGRCYALSNGWPSDFFHRRGLRKDDEVELYWDRSDFKLHFGVLFRTPNPSDEERREEKSYNVSTKQTLFTDRWTIKMKLTMRYYGLESYLPLNKWFVEDHILKYFSEDDKNMVQQGSELTVNVYDHDTDSMLQLLLGKLTKDGSYALRNGWPLDYFHRKSLKKDDIIGLYWDRFDSKLHFSVLSRAPIKVTSGYATKDSAS